MPRTARSPMAYSWFLYYATKRTVRLGRYVVFQPVPTNDVHRCNYEEIIFRKSMSTSFLMLENFGSLRVIPSFEIRRTEHSMIGAASI